MILFLIPSFSKVEKITEDTVLSDKVAEFLFHKRPEEQKPSDLVWVRTHIQTLTRIQLTIVNTNTNSIHDIMII